MSVCLVAHIQKELSCLIYDERCTYVLDMSKQKPNQKLGNLIEQVFVILIVMNEKISIYLGNYVVSPFIHIIFKNYIYIKHHSRSFINGDIDKNKS